VSQTKYCCPLKVKIFGPHKILDCLSYCLQLGFNYLTLSLSKVLAKLSRTAKVRNAPVVSAFSPVSLLVYGDNHNSLPTFRYPTKFFGTLSARPLDSHE